MKNFDKILGILNVLEVVLHNAINSHYQNYFNDQDCIGISAYREAFVDDWGDGLEIDVRIGEDCNGKP